MPAQRVVLILKSAGAGSLVEVDGKEVKNVRALTLRCGVGEPTSLTLEHTNIEVNVDADAEVNAPPVRRYCRQCKHFLPAFTSPYLTQKLDDLCLNPMMLDVVGNAPTPYKARECGPGKCGPSGAYWERKPPVLKPQQPAPPRPSFWKRLFG